MAKKHLVETHEEHMNETWLIPYSDLVTLLLALFIVLFAASNLDKAKYNAFMDAMFTAFNGTVTETETSGSGANLPYPDAGMPMSNEEMEQMEQQAAENAARNAAQMNDFYNDFQEYIAQNGLQGRMSASHEGESVMVTLSNDAWFASGSADITPQLADQAAMIARLLEQNQTPARPLIVTISGHTDNVPSTSQQYPSNWHLSIDRAVNFLGAILSGDPALSPANFSVEGYGENAPVATNTTPEGRQQNRRVEILVRPPTTSEQIAGELTEAQQATQ